MVPVTWGIRVKDPTRTLLDSSFETVHLIDELAITAPGAEQTLSIPLEAGEIGWAHVVRASTTLFGWANVVGSTLRYRVVLGEGASASGTVYIVYGSFKP